MTNPLLKKVLEILAFPFVIITILTARISLLLLGGQQEYFNYVSKLVHFIFHRFHKHE